MNTPQLMHTSTADRRRVHAQLEAEAAAFVVGGQSTDTAVAWVDYVGGAVTWRRADFAVNGVVLPSCRHITEAIGPKKHERLLAFQIGGHRRQAERKS